ncbi:SDR family NAD(P)-dependent oxidoreductase [Paraburkholderia unamae]|uniref:SDR family NAD(P)-dependent oxidoreductase n=1 Tax=Paraburkholderia unamae TaxID=219649 RepID=UPI003CCC4DAF
MSRPPTAVGEVFNGIGNRYGRIDVLCNNAEINRRRASMELSLEDWNALIAANITGILTCKVPTSPRRARSPAERPRHPTPGGPCSQSR